jgi:hypothetical protein
MSQDIYRRPAAGHQHPVQCHEVDRLRVRVAARRTGAAPEHTRRRVP